MLELHYTRRASRREVDIPCELVRRDWDEPINHRVTDISSCGVWIRTTFPMPVGEQVVLSFTAPGGDDDVLVFAQVTRIVRSHLRGSATTGMGLEFIDLQEDECETLKRRLRHLPEARRVSFGVPKPVLN